MCGCSVGLSKGGWKLGEGDHRLGADVEHGLQHGGEVVPLRERVGHRLVEDENADDLRSHQAQAAMDRLAVVAQREGRPAIDLVEAVAELHALGAAGIEPQ